MSFVDFVIAGGVQPPSAACCEDYLRRVVKELGVDRAPCDPSDDAIEALVHRLGSVKVDPNSCRNCRTALRWFAAFREGRPKRSGRARTMLSS